MLALPHTNSWGFVYTNQDNGSNTPGTQVASGTSGSEGSWGQIAAAASITTDIYYVTLLIHGGGTSGAARQYVLDFGWDPAGGTSYAAFFNNLAMGSAATFNTGNACAAGARMFHFPCKIPAGSSVAVRTLGADAFGAPFYVAHFYGKPSRPELWRPAAYSETVGYSSGATGTSFTPGNAAWGSWASLGTTTKKNFWAQLGIQVNNTTMQTASLHYQLAIGDGTNQRVIIDGWGASSLSETFGHHMQQPCSWEIPAGAELWIRGNNSASPASGYNATAVLFGG